MSVHHCVTTGELVDELRSRAPRIGANTGLWPGLTIHRISDPGRFRPHPGPRPSVGVLIDADGDGFVLDLDHAAVVRAEVWPHSTVVTSLDDELLCATVRFLRALTTDADRRVLAPMYMRELVYRVRQRDPDRPPLPNAAATPTPVDVALRHIHAHLATPLTVTGLAALAGLSPSAFSRTFRRSTGRSPYQYVKNVRLDRACELLADPDFGVAAVAEKVGYASTSHFIKEFRARFGATPGALPSRASASALGVPGCAS